MHVLLVCNTISHAVVLFSSIALSFDQREKLDQSKKLALLFASCPHFNRLLSNRFLSLSLSLSLCKLDSFLRRLLSCSDPVLILVHFVAQARMNSSSSGDISSPVVCNSPSMISMGGVWRGESPLDFSFPLFLLQLLLIVLTTRAAAILLQPLQQPRYLAEIIVSSR